MRIRDEAVEKREGTSQIEEGPEKNQEGPRKKRERAGSNRKAWKQQERKNGNKFKKTQKRSARMGKDHQGTRKGAEKEEGSNRRETGNKLKRTRKRSARIGKDH